MQVWGKSEALELYQDVEVVVGAYDHTPLLPTPTCIEAEAIEITTQKQAPGWRSTFLRFGSQTQVLNEFRLLLLLNK
ncbi:MAG: hypothetical protein A3G32_00310 [Deltaproteobacteria bacterium RIFCSPLOWO2_12_FULL_40_28]|nr:MAG: hypothetical protein A3C45_03465 [Deltaproteobacteria bacterium RIFCSPHIGHO2_02_FULL_40_28]OGQ19166.1 MAG: hypothetical protein A3E27_02350 [Deltaproteobacteria bacterium RIFCSPHIGHO2_12_FULL_40_32]OGQ39782.1 MAG: hypothetical protein A3I69_07425 [Deltaproteobacteria bacterium RIFCSPLOWO2_02_FULL_40_36]OGQ53618.1 MAG: hypothetical protein A3G32_00310 [Deltaproteobacteria bacterium RIFCSPLOWO2_12_FULL_40_28]